MDDIAALLPKDLNPYYAIWMAAMGGRATWEYMAWNQRQWRDFEDANGLPRERLRPTQINEFTAYLLKTHADAIRARFGLPREGERTPPAETLNSEKGSVT